MQEVKAEQWTLYSTLGLVLSWNYPFSSVTCKIGITIEKYVTRDSRNWENLYPLVFIPQGQEISLYCEMYWERDLGLLWAPVLQTSVSEHQCFPRGRGRRAHLSDHFTHVISESLKNTGSISFENRMSTLPVYLLQMGEKRCLPCLTKNQFGLFLKESLGHQWQRDREHMGMSKISRFWDSLSNIEILHLNCLWHCAD